MNTLLSNSDEPLVLIGPSNLGITRIDELDGATIALQTGLDSERALAEAFSTLGISYEPVPVENYQEMVQQVAAGAGDFGLMPESIAAEAGFNAPEWIAISGFEFKNDSQPIIGSDLSEGIVGTAFADQINGLAGNDLIEGGAGDDTLDGGSGTDTALNSGPAGSYVLSLNGGSEAIVLEDKRVDGTGLDTLASIELLQFGDGFSFNSNGVFDLREITGAVGLSQDMLTTFVEMYVAYFDRAPDALGLLYWGSRLADGMDLGQIAQSFFFQEETFALYPELDGLSGVDDPSVLSVEFYTQLVVDTYNKLLERDPDAEGQAFWIGELQNGNVRLGEFVLAIINGAKDFNPVGATPEQIAQAALDTQTVEEKGQLGYSFSVDNGMNDVDNARDVMATYAVDARESSIAAAEALIAQYRDAAGAADSTEIIVQVAGLGEDPLAV